MSFEVLVVCRANVCRSPAAELLIRHELERRNLGVSIEVQSRAVVGSDRMERCAIAGKYLRARGLDTTDMLNKGARTLRIQDVQAADLILTADQSVGADVVRLAPRLRPKVFTLREGAVLAETAMSEFDSESVTGRDLEKSRLEHLVSEMDASRGLVPMPSGSGGLMRRRRQHISGFDVADVHNSSRRKHRLMVADVASLATTIVMTVERVVAATPDREM